MSSWLVVRHIDHLATESFIRYKLCQLYTGKLYKIINLPSNFSGGPSSHHHLFRSALLKKTFTGQINSFVEFVCTADSMYNLEI